MKKIILGLLYCAHILLFSGCADTEKVTAQDLDMEDTTDANDKKLRFFDFMRPIVNEENQKVLALREKLLAAKKNSSRKTFVAKTAYDYNVEWEPGKENWNRLLARVDAIALELVLAQSANESAWGQSRFAIEGNNFFGQWCYKKGCGMVPDKRDEGTSHEVARFKSVNASVRSYLKNINTGRVYAPLRKIRQQNRAAGKEPDAYAQAGGLIKYSQRREAYVKEIRSIIQANRSLMLGEETDKPDDTQSAIKTSSFSLAEQ
jgi:Bax protein